MISKYIATKDVGELGSYDIASLQESLGEAMAVLREAAELISCSQNRDLLRKMWRLLDKWEGE